MANQVKKIKLKHSGPLSKWVTPQRNSQSLSSTTSPSGRYFFVAYLFGVNAVNTETGEENFYLLHPDQSFLEQIEFNICGFIAISDSIGYTIERTGRLYGDYYLRRIEFFHSDGTYWIEEEPLTLAFKVKWLTACFDYQHATQEMHVILRHEIREADRVNDRLDCRRFWTYKLTNERWVKSRQGFPLEALDNLNSWDWFPKLQNDSIYVFPIKSASSTLYEKLQQLNEIAKINLQSGEMELLPVKGGLEKWAEGKKYDSALFVDNMDFKWVGTSLFLLFIVVIREDGRSRFQNRMAVFSLDEMEWREVEVGEYCRGEFSPNPYRMQVAPNDQIYLLIPSRGHPCTTFGRRANSDRRRLLWVPPTLPGNNDEDGIKNDSDKSIMYSIPLGSRTPVIFADVARKRVNEVHPQLADRPFYEYKDILNGQPPYKRMKMNEELFIEEEMVGSGVCKA